MDLFLRDPFIPVRSQYPIRPCSICEKQLAQKLIRAIPTLEDSVAICIERYMAFTKHHMPHSHFLPEDALSSREAEMKFEEGVHDPLFMSWHPLTQHQAEYLLRKCEIPEKELDTLYIVGNPLFKKRVLDDSKRRAEYYPTHWLASACFFISPNSEVNSSECSKE